MEKNWIKFHVTHNFYQAEIIKQALLENDIEAVVLNKQDSSYQMFGMIELYIHQDNFGKATEVMILNQLND